MPKINGHAIAIPIEIPNTIGTDTAIKASCVNFIRLRAEPTPNKIDIVMYTMYKSI
jgi:hypothetical protein